MDYLAGAKYRKEILKSHPDQWAAGFFAETFGDSFPTARALLITGRCPMIRVNLLWSDTHSFGDKDIPKIKKLAKKWNKLAVEFPTVRIEISAFCEHNISKPDKYLDIVQESAPQCRAINTPWKGGFSKKYKNEVHGEHKAPKGRYNYSFDGTNCVDSDIEKIKEKHRDSEYFFYWHPRFNLKYSMKDKTPRPKRKAFPTVELLDSVSFLHTEKGGTKVPKNILVKSHAEKHDAQDKKGDKLLIIAPFKANRIELLTNSGKLIDTLNYYGPFDGGGHRYYSARFGYLNSKMGIIAAGTPLLQIWSGGKNYGTCNPGFRDPTYR